MADPIAQLQLYWIKLDADDADFSDLIDAQNAMKDAITAGVYKADERTRFAQANAFANTLTKNDDVLVDAMQRTMQAGMFQLPIPGGGPDTRPVRAVMLDLMRDASTGSSWYLLKVPGGVAPWISDAQSTAKIFYKTLTQDPSNVVLASALKLMSEASLPVVWVQYILANDPRGEAIVSRIARSSLSPAEREKLISMARGAVGELAAKYSVAAAAQLEASWSTSGTGEEIQMFPPAQPPPWYKKTSVGVAVAGVFGALVGGAMRVRRRK